MPADHIRAGDDKYRAPEVKEDAFQPDPKNDIFSLGMTLLEMAGDFYLPNGGVQWIQLRRNNFPLSQLKGGLYESGLENSIYFCIVISSTFLMFSRRIGCID